MKRIGGFEGRKIGGRNERWPHGTQTEFCVLSGFNSSLGGVKQAARHLFER
jgi:hypothetical protein